MLSRKAVATCSLNITQLSEEVALYQKAIYDAIVKEWRAQAGAVARNLGAQQLGESHRGWSLPEHMWFIRGSDAHFDILASNHIDVLEGWIRDLSTHDRPTTQIVYGSLQAPYVDYAMTELGRDFQTEGRPARLLEAKMAERMRVLPMLSEAMELMRESWPAAAMEHDLIIRKIVLLDCGSMRSATLAETFGATYICPQEDWTLVEYFDLLLHECAHHSLEIKTSMVNFLANPDQIGTGVLRGGDRPLHALLHAAFVMARVVHGLRRAYCNLHGTPRQLALTLSTTYRDTLIATLRELNRLAGWTVEGRALVESMRELGQVGGG